MFGSELLRAGGMRLTFCGLPHSIDAARLKIVHPMNTKMFLRTRFSIYAFSAVALVLLGSSAYGTTHTVTSLSGGFGPGTLRGELDNCGPGDTVNFAVTGTITVLPGGIVLNLPGTVFIVGPGARKLRINATELGFSLFRLTAGDLRISGLTFGPGDAAGFQVMGGTLTLDDCALSGLNTGVSVDAGATAKLNRCTVSGNINTASLSNGGGASNAGTFTATSCTFSGNSADTGGGLYNGAGTMTLLNCTVTGNTGNNSGGGIRRSGGTFRVANTIVASNTSANGADCFGTFVSDGYNLIAISTPSAGFVDGVNHDIVGTAATPLLVFLGPLQDNGGPTDTTAILFSGSYPVNAANGATAPTHDQRGFIRSGNADIGAFEYAGTLATSLANISSRAVVQTGDNVIIGGFIITGAQPKKVMVRAIGPSLTVPGKLSNPVLELYNASQLVTSNDDWGSAPNVQEIIDSTIAPTNAQESAILMSLDPGTYTAIVRGAGGGTGVGLVEAYDLDRTVGSRLGNISTRAFVQTGDNVLIGGFIVLGPENLSVIVRGIGTSLTGIPFHMLDPTLELHDGNGSTLGANDNWRSTQQSEIIATGVPPSSDAESAIVQTLTPGNYTAILRGANNTAGVAVVEVYGLVPP